MKITGPEGWLHNCQAKVDPEDYAIKCVADKFMNIEIISLPLIL